MTALQFNLNVPCGITVVTGNITLGDATDGHILRMETLDSGDLLFVLYSMDFKEFKEGELLRIPLTAGDNEITDVGRIYTVRTTTVDANSVECNNSTFNVTVKNEMYIKAKSYSREYGDENPTFEYTIEGAALEGTPEISCEATASSPVGEYPIVIAKGSVTDYNYTYVNGTLTIMEAPLKVSVSDYCREQGQENPEFLLNYSGWKNGEDERVLDCKPIATTIATKDSEPGEYPITVSGGRAQNYIFEYVNGILTVQESLGILDIITDKKTLVVYSISGMKYHVESLRSLKKGLYIVNGKKVIIK